MENRKNQNKDSTLYEKILVLGDNNIGKTSLIQNLTTEEKMSSLSSFNKSTQSIENIIKTIAEDTKTAISNKNIPHISDKIKLNEISNGSLSKKKDNNSEIKNEEKNDNNNIIKLSNITDIKSNNTEGTIKKQDKENNNVTLQKNNEDTNEIKKEESLIINERKILIKNELNMNKNLQVFEASTFDLIQPLVYMCQCILIVFNKNNYSSFEKAKQFLILVKTELKIPNYNIILISLESSNNTKNNNSKINIDEINSLLNDTSKNEQINNYLNNENDVNNNYIRVSFIEVSLLNKKNIIQLKNEIIKSYNGEVLLYTPISLSSNEEYNNYKQNHNYYEMYDNNLIQGHLYLKKKSSSISTKSKSNKDFLSSINSIDKTCLIKTKSPKSLFKLITDNNKPIIIYNYSIIRLILLGDSLVGKTSFYNKFFYDKFEMNLNSTIGIIENSKLIQYNDNFYKIELWDTAGQERFKSLPKKYYQKVDGVILLYDITNEKSFDNTIKWLKDLYESANENTIIYLLGNKIDLYDKRKIGFETAFNIAKQKNIKFMEISCKLDLNINDCLYNLIYDIIYMNQESEDENIPFENEKIDNRNNFARCC